MDYNTNTNSLYDTIELLEDSMGLTTLAAMRSALSNVQVRRYSDRIVSLHIVHQQLISYTLYKVRDKFRE